MNTEGADQEGRMPAEQMQPHRGRRIVDYGALGLLPTCIVLVFWYVKTALSAWLANGLFFLWPAMSVLGCVAGIKAWIMANIDLRKMAEGVMDPSGRDMTRKGRFLAIESSIVNFIFLVLWITLYCMALSLRHLLHGSR